MASPKTILIRTDTNSCLGMGHFSRMIAFGQLCKSSGFEVHYILSTENQYILDSIYDEDFIVHNYLDKFKWNSREDRNFLLNVANKIKTNWIVIDGEQFDLKYEKSIKKNYKLMRVVDFSIKHTYADLLFDQNYGAENNSYLVEPYAVVLLGIRYLLLRKEFHKARLDNSLDFGYKDSTKVNRILVPLGGGSEITDLVNRKIIKAISKLKEDNLSITIVLGPFSQNIDSLKELADRLSPKIQMENSVDNMAEKMSNYSLAILSGGSIMWEAAYMGIPFMGVALTKKQKPYLEKLSKEGLCIDLGWYDDLTIEKMTKNISYFIKNQSTLKKNIYNFGKLNFAQNEELLTSLNRSNK